jgi:hypothetical protein
MVFDDDAGGMMEKRFMKTLVLRLTLTTVIISYLRESINMPR